MSNRSTPDATSKDSPKQPTKREARQSARERLAQERARQRELAARNRRIKIGAGISGGLLVIAGIAVAITTAGGGDAVAGPLKVPANSTGTDGTTIVYGNPSNPNVLDIYEDFRCPICDKLEKADGPTIQQLADNGTYVIHYHMGTFLDGNLGGDGSHQALAAAGAALDEGTAKFKAWHDVLYANQPASEDTDAFGSTSYLLQLARKVPGLSTPAFVDAVKNGTYLPWADKVTDTFNSSGVTGTPTFKLNGRTINLFTAVGPITPAQYTQAVQQAIAATKK